MNYIITDFRNVDVQTFKNEISEGIEFEISFPLSSIGFSNSRIDIIRDYSEVSYCCERIAPLLQVLNSDIVTRDKYYTDFKIKCIAIDVENLTNELLHFSEMLSGELVEYDDLDVISFVSEVSDYEESYNKRIFEFPDLINNYWANLINGAYWEMADEYNESQSMFFNKIYRKYPEQRYGFWKSPLSKKISDTIYFSIENWIIPPNTNLTEALKVYSGLENNLFLEDADQIEYKGLIVIINNSTAVYFNQKEQLINSIKCTEQVFKKKANRETSSDNFEDNANRIQTGLFGEDISQKRRTKYTRHNNDIQIDETELKYQLSEFGDLITIEYKEFTHVFFSNDALTFEEIKDLNSFLYPAYSKTQNLINNSISEKCNWIELNDDTFEELCYDILYLHPNFDSTTIQKMGKSKSRDGGRDIVIKTKRTPTNEPKLYIFQCKFLSNTSSLSASKISNAANVIMQYGANGYGVFTTSVIDSTLYDMLDGFNKNMSIDTSYCWSKYELERHLNKYQMIKNKYFIL